jgi:hypothetical protein
VPDVTRGTCAQECELRSLNNADGSARFNFGRSSVLTGVHGPREGKASQKDSSESIVVVNFGAKGAVGSQWDRSNEAVMRECLEAMVVRTQNPMCVIDVTVQPMCEDGAQLAASFNAAVAALIDAGVALRFVAVGLCFAITSQESMLLDPTREEVVAPQRVHRRLRAEAMPMSRSLRNQGAQKLVQSVPYGMQTISALVLTDVSTARDQEQSAAALLTFVIRPSDGHVVCAPSAMSTHLPQKPPPPPSE